MAAARDDLEVSLDAQGGKSAARNPSSDGADGARYDVPRDRAAIDRDAHATAGLQEDDPDRRPFFRHSYLEDLHGSFDARRWEQQQQQQSVDNGPNTAGVKEGLVAQRSPLEEREHQAKPVRRASVFREQLHSATHSRGHSSGQDMEGTRAGNEPECDLTEIAAPAPVEDFRKRRAHRHSGAQRESLEHGQDTGMTELEAPAPYQGAESREQTDDLESAEQDEKPRRPPGTDWITQIYVIGYLIFFSIMGVLARQGTEWLTFYPGAPVIISNLWANFGGTFFLGFVTEDRQMFREEWGDDSEQRRDRKQSEQATKAAHLKVKKTIPLFIGLSVGFCGSYTSFSTFMRDIFLAISNNVPTPMNHPGQPVNLNSTVSRNGGFSFEAALAILILTVTVSVSALYFGAHCAMALDGWMPAFPFRFLRSLLDPLITFLGVGCWVGAVVMSVLPPDRPGGSLGGSPDSESWRGDVLFALVFAPLGCLTRFYLGVYLNSQVPQFPLGTFAANMLGTAVLGMCYDLQHVSLGNSLQIGGGRVGCQVLQGVQDGYSGALTTVSTWVNELRSLETKHAYVYGAVSVLAGVALLVVIMGSVRWTVGFGELACTVLIT